ASVAGLLDQLGHDTAHTAGNSLGAWVALELAAAGRASSVTGVCAAGLWSKPLGPRPGGVSPQGMARLARPFLPAVARSEGLRRRALSGIMAHPENMSASEAARTLDSYASARG